jgi:hypothetical protein
MKEPTINCQRTIVAYGQSPVVAQPSERALDDPSTLVAPQGATILRRCLASARSVRDDRFDTATTQSWLSNPPKVLRRFIRECCDSLNASGRGSTKNHAA